MSGPLNVVKYGALIPVSTDQLVYFSIHKPTPEEQAEWDAQRAELELRKQAATDALPQFISALDAVTDPTARAVLDLHKPDWYGTCQGDDFGGYECEPPGWPCRTVEVVAGVLGIAVPPDLEMVRWLA